MFKIKTMKNHFFLLIFSLILVGCNAQSSELEAPQTEINQIQYEALFDLIQKNDDKVYAVNFWATWCKPCIVELPEFMAVNHAFANEPNFKMYLVSMDLPKLVDSKVIPFLKKNDIKAETILLDDNKRMNTWIPKFDESWSGSIPATVFYKNGEKIFFHEGQLTQEQLTEIISKNL